MFMKFNKKKIMFMKNQTFINNFPYYLINLIIQYPHNNNNNKISKY